MSEHDHGHDHDESHDHGHGIGSRIRHYLLGHSHDPAPPDPVIDSSREGIRVVWISLTILLATAAAQAVIYSFTGSVALLSDTFHNLADGLTAVPLGIAFLVGRRAANNRYTYGYGRWEDIAGVVVSLAILGTATLTAVEALGRLRDPEPITNVGIVGAAALGGFIANEAVARYRIRVGNRIGSAALIAEGQHARADAITSVGVGVAAAGSAMGYEIVDPVMGLVIAFAILAVARSAIVSVGRRIVDAIDPAVTNKLEVTANAQPGVLSTTEIRIRWVGHKLHASCTVSVDRNLTIAQAHLITENVEHQLMHALPHLSSVSVHACPEGDRHSIIQSHREADC